MTKKIDLLSFYKMFNKKKGDNKIYDNRIRMLATNTSTIQYTLSLVIF